MNEWLKQYIHPNWEDSSEHREDKYYFVKCSDQLEQQGLELKYQLELDIPEGLRVFYQKIGYGFLWFHLKQKKGVYRILSPEELLDLYFEPEEEETPDEWITYRETAWEKLENNQLFAFCLFGEEDSLLYIGLTDGAIYYLSTAHKIADSMDDFLYRLDQNVDYFVK